MKLVRETCVLNEMIPLALNDLLKKLQKKSSTLGVEKDELKSVLEYY